jgi:hypothetical protein
MIEVAKHRFSVNSDLRNCYCEEPIQRSKLKDKNSFFQP